jgi:hypothetical protein
MFRKIALVGTAVGLALAAFFAGDWAASASGTQLQVTSGTETIVNSHCYTYSRYTTTYFEYSKTKGWVQYAAPKRTHTTGETCH